MFKKSKAEQAAAEKVETEANAQKQIPQNNVEVNKVDAAFNYPQTHLQQNVGTTPALQGIWYFKFIFAWLLLYLYICIVYFNVAYRRCTLSK